MKRTFKTVQVAVHDPKEMNDALNAIATNLHTEKYEVVSHCIYKDDHTSYTFIISVLAKKDSYL